jgi:hypothetical protein
LKPFNQGRRMADTDEVAGRARAAASLERPAGSGIRRDGARSSFRKQGLPGLKDFPKN